MDDISIEDEVDWSISPIDSPDLSIVERDEVMTDLELPGPSFQGDDDYLNADEASTEIPAAGTFNSCE